MEQDHQLNHPKVVASADAIALLLYLEIANHLLEEEEEDVWVHLVYLCLVREVEAQED